MSLRKEFEVSAPDSRSGGTQPEAWADRPPPAVKDDIPGDTSFLYEHGEPIEGYFDL